MKFKLTVTDERTTWTEEYDKPITNPQQWAQDTVTQFNNTLGKNERPRRLLNVDVLDASSNSPTEHDWEKQNIYTVMGKNFVYDVHKCKGCGITAKRYGLSENFLRDPPFKAKVYAHCNTAQKQLAKVAAQQLAKQEKRQK